MDELLLRNIGQRFCAPRWTPAAPFSDSELTFIAVGTPFDGENIDLTYIKESARVIGEALRDKPGYHVVVVKSTVVPGTTDSRRAPHPGRSVGQKGGGGFRPRHESRVPDRRRGRRRFHGFPIGSSVAVSTVVRRRPC
ncbi:MAG: hypothetical protein WDO74_30770 [Pseudomonadota bacterium]